MPTTAKGISFEELEGSPVISVNNQGVSAARTFKVALDDYIAFCQEIIGVYQKIGSSVRSLPTIGVPGLPATLLADDIRVEPFDPSKPDGSAITTIGNATNRYDNGAKITVVYKQHYSGLPKAKS